MLFTDSRTRVLVLAAIVLILIGLAIGYYVSSMTPERKPVEFQEKRYDYYIIIDEATNNTLAYVATITVNEGDEYLNEDGKWYVIVKVEENRAYARRFEKKQ